MKNLKKNVRSLSITVVLNYMVAVTAYIVGTLAALLIIIHFDLGLGMAFLSPFWGFILALPFIYVFGVRAENIDKRLKKEKLLLHRAKRSIAREKYLAEKAKKENSI